MEGSGVSSHTEINARTLVKASDELNLSNVTIPKDIIFPDELNRYLRDQVQRLTQENGTLKTSLREKCTQLSETQATLEQLQGKLDEYLYVNKSGYTSATAVASAKIVELSKKVRERNSEIEVLKTKVSRLEKNLIHELNKNQETVEVQTVPEKQAKPENELEDQIKTLQDKLSFTSQKLFDAKNANMQLKTEMKVANKLLQQEIGESFETLHNITNSSNWRGRAQIICDLQQKVSDLKEKLKTHHDKSTEMTPQERRSYLSRFQVRAQTLAKENENLKQEVEVLKRKLEGSKARCKILESEYNGMKIKASTLVEQNERDHELVTSLMGQLANARELQNDVAKQKHQIIMRLEEENRKLRVDLTKEQCRNENLREIVDRHKEGKSGGHISPRKPNTDDKEHEKLVSKLTAEKDKLLELIEHTKKRVEKERDAHANTQKQFNAERQRAAKLEAKLARAQLEYSERSSYTSGSSKQSLSAVEDQLELAQENVKALKTRLELEREERQIDLQEFAKILRATTCRDKQNIDVYT